MQTLTLLVASGAGFMAGAFALRGWQRWKPWRLYPAQMPRHERRRALLAMMPTTPSIIMLGDSLIEDCPWAEFLGLPGVANFGISGDTSAAVIARLDDVIKLTPQVVVLMIGANDIGFCTPIETTLSNVRLISRAIRDCGAHLIITGLFPISGAQPMVDCLNFGLARLTAQISVDFLHVPIIDEDLVDGLHLKPAGYEKWREAILPLMRRYGLTTP